MTGNPLRLNATAFANEAWTASLPFVEGDTKLPVDLTDLAMAMQLRRQPSAATVDLSLSTLTGEIVVVDPPERGLIALDVPVDRVRQLSGTYHYDLVVWPAGAREQSRVWLVGQINVSTGVTR